MALQYYRKELKSVEKSVVVGHRLEIIIDHQLELDAAVDAIF